MARALHGPHALAIAAALSTCLTHCTESDSRLLSKHSERGRLTAQPAAGNCQLALPMPCHRALDPRFVLRRTCRWPLTIPVPSLLGTHVTQAIHPCLTPSTCEKCEALPASPLVFARARRPLASVQRHGHKPGRPARGGRSSRRRRGRVPLGVAASSAAPSVGTAALRHRDVS